MRASCHGPDGRGVAEGTVAPADVRWRILSKPFIATDGGRHRPRYDGALLIRAVREAIDADGTPLFAVMPHYRIDDHDLDDLVAYMRRLGDEPQPGLDDATIVVGTVVPMTGPRAPAGEAVRNVISLSDEGRDEIESFGARHHLSKEQRATEIAAYAAVKVFVEALRRGGRDVTRETLIASLEHLYGFTTGVTPAITYGPNRHIGSVGAYVVGIDFDRRTFAAASRWITPTE